MSTNNLTNHDTISYWLSNMPACNKNQTLYTDMSGAVLFSYGKLIGEWKNGIPLVYNYTATAKLGPYGHPVPSLKSVSHTTTTHVNLAIKLGGLLVPRYGKEL